MSQKDKMLTRAANIKLGMTKAEVMALMGRPTKIVSHTYFDKGGSDRRDGMLWYPWILPVKWYYISVDFTDGLVDTVFYK
jgi:hypothetical protein